jgi:thymidylate synthase
MKVLRVRNVHEALPRGIKYLLQEGIHRDSRNGPVLVAPEPVSTVYEHPLENVVFWPERDCNPFFHIYESLWMLAGRNDAAGPARYAKQMATYSDDGQTLHGAYGYRWRKSFSIFQGWNEAMNTDQLEIIANTLKNNHEDRRSVLQMWSPTIDLGQGGKDLPCNLTATFQRDSDNRLNLVVFCRSNDIIWGAYGANAVHFSFLLEYMARWIECQVGTYTQISVNYHAYLDTLEPVKRIAFNAIDTAGYVPNPYAEGKVGHQAMPPGALVNWNFDEVIAKILEAADKENFLILRPFAEMNLWEDTVVRVLFAHEIIRTMSKPNCYKIALGTLAAGDTTIDWIVAGIEWIQRRQTAWERKYDLEHGGTAQ